jgi:hypothetical protein
LSATGSNSAGPQAAGEGQAESRGCHGHFCKGKTRKKRKKTKKKELKLSANNTQHMAATAHAGRPSLGLRADPGPDVLVPLGAKHAQLPVPRAAVLPRPLKHCQVAALCCFAARPAVPRAAVLPRPLQHCQVAALCCFAARQAVPRAASLPRQLQRRQVATCRGSCAHLRVEPAPHVVAPEEYELKQRAGAAARGTHSRRVLLRRREPGPRLAQRPQRRGGAQLAPQLPLRILQPPPPRRGPRPPLAAEAGDGRHCSIGGSRSNTTCKPAATRSRVASLSTARSAAPCGRAGGASGGLAPVVLRPGLQAIGRAVPHLTTGKWGLSLVFQEIRPPSFLGCAVASQAVPATARLRPPRPRTPSACAHQSRLVAATRAAAAAGRRAALAPDRREQ